MDASDTLSIVESSAVLADADSLSKFFNSSSSSAVNSPLAAFADSIWNLATSNAILSDVNSSFASALTLSLVLILKESMLVLPLSLSLVLKEPSLVLPLASLLVLRESVPDAESEPSSDSWETDSDSSDSESDAESSEVSVEVSSDS